MFEEKLSLIQCFSEGDDLKTENPTKSIEKFERVVELESARGDQVKWQVFF